MRKNHRNRCMCDARDGIQKDEEEDKLHQFLMGLNEIYVGVRSNLLMMQPPPTLDSAYNILLQDENQRQVQYTPQLVPEAASFNVNANNKDFHPNANNKTFPPKKYTQKMDFHQSRGNILCKYRKKPGHLIDKCYKLYGFPQNFKFNKGKRMAANVTVEAEYPATAYTLPQYNSPQLYTASDHEEHVSSVPGLTKQQYAQLMSLLQ
ncbi:uncharacterized protein LOC107763937 [Nicotiana tabacum]|uniref:Uncharacterized protein n=2 Tax=Nicotiana tabacum TaxID=4097 RepID=A0A1S3XDB6_TOBAC|nr:PREDICTED: uncharacterized protein LOC107763937 [Nicotiana tabacum]